MIDNYRFTCKYRLRCGALVIVMETSTSASEWYPLAGLYNRRRYIWTLRGEKDRVGELSSYDLVGTIITDPETIIEGVKKSLKLSSWD